MKGYTLQLGSSVLQKCWISLIWFQRFGVCGWPSVLPFKWETVSQACPCLERLCVGLFWIFFGHCSSVLLVLCITGCFSPYQLNICSFMIRRLSSWVEHSNSQWWIRCKDQRCIYLVQYSFLTEDSSRHS